jgi:hypothetical protein
VYNAIGAHFSIFLSVLGGLYLLSGYCCQRSPIDCAIEHYRKSEHNLKIISMKATKQLGVVSLIASMFCVDQVHSEVLTSFGTSTSTGWSVATGNVQNAVPYTVGWQGASLKDCLSITTTGDRTGSFLTGGNLGTFSGYWTATYSFFVPSDATAISLIYSNFKADDRAVLQLNGNVICAVGWPAPNGQTSGIMDFTDGGTSQSDSFTSNDSPLSGTISRGFIDGGINTIKIIINNTGSGVQAKTAGLVGVGDYTEFSLSGSVSYTSVPEPGKAILFLFGFAGVCWLGRRPIAHIR